MTPVLKDGKAFWWKRPAVIPVGAKVRIVEKRFRRAARRVLGGKSNKHVYGIVRGNNGVCFQYSVEIIGVGDGSYLLDVPMLRREIVEVRHGR